MELFIDFITWFNDAVGLITLLAGLIVVYLYLKQRKDSKRAAASLILQEIRYAEQRISDYRRFGEYKLYDQLLPTNSWNDNIHLFVKDLKETEIDLISRFYSQAEYVDVLIKKIGDSKASTSTPSVPAAPSPIAPLPGGGSVTPPPSFFAMLHPPIQAILNEISNEAESIYNTPAIEKLRKISEKRWYQIL